MKKISNKFVNFGALEDVNPQIANLTFNAITSPGGIPENMKVTVVLSTSDQTSGKDIVEGYNVNGPTGQGVVANKLKGGNISVVTLSTTSYLKIYFPTKDTDAGKVFITYAEKIGDSNDPSDYQDFTDVATEEFIKDLENWILAGNTIPAGMTAVQIARKSWSRDLNFTSIGSATNKIDKAISFTVRFKTKGAPSSSPAA